MVKYRANHPEYRKREQLREKTRVRVKPTDMERVRELGRRRSKRYRDRKRAAHT